MNLKQFAEACALEKQNEVERACLLAFFYIRTTKIEEFTASDATKWLVAFGFSEPNRTRLEGNLKASSYTIRGQRGFKLKLPYLSALDAKYPQLQEKSQDVVDHGTILPEVEYAGTRGYIIALAKQINLAYEDNIFDGCAVIMRRLVEVLLILSYQHFGIDAVIKGPDGNYKMFEGIINEAKTNSTLSLSRNSKESLEVFRKLGNFSAHKIEYTCRREYIQPHIMEFRGLVIELLHKSGLKV